MYNHFFGFKERPFKLVPNPDYLFLSKSHEEALAHLRYAVTDGEGFVEIIGEIGTGKTMLCRTFLESLGEDTESAYIFNPRMDALDLLKAVNDEFGIPKDHDSIKGLIDELNAFLIEKKAAGKRVILLIDEAQNLSKEVLEQIRLLSNLETTKDKLLQIILVGQPELGEMLDSYELRQLGQRISLSCRLHPLTYSETKEYIAHRIHVAAQKSVDVFSGSAIRKIYQFSRGIPRLINIACDRSLLTAFGRHQLKVSGSIAGSAILELASRGEIRRHVMAGKTKKRIAAAALCAAAFIVLFFHRDIRRTIFHDVPSGSPVAFVEMKANPDKAPAPAFAAKSATETEKSTADLSGETAKPAEAVSPKAEPVTEIKNSAQPVDFDQVLIDGAGMFSRKTSFENVLKTWGLDQNQHPDINGIPDDPAFFSLAAQRIGLAVTPVEADLARIVRLNMPAVLQFEHPSGTGRMYLTAIHATPETMIFAGSQSLPEIAVPYAKVLQRWNGSAFVFWKNFYNYQGVIPLDAPGESVITLKLHLRDIGYRHIDISGTYDLATQMAIKAIQARHGIPIDGFVGPLTKIVLYNEKQSLAIPHLWEQMKIADELTDMGIKQKSKDPAVSGPDSPAK